MKIIWWNVAYRPGGFGGDGNFPVQDTETGTALVSGFSPSILKHVLKAEVMTPWHIMMETITNARYAPVLTALESVGT